MPPIAMDDPCNRRWHHGDTATSSLAPRAAPVTVHPVPGRP